MTIEEMREELIAPCGMNCGICSGYLASKYDVKGKGVKMPYCIGCRPRDENMLSLRSDVIYSFRVRCDTTMSVMIFHAAASKHSISVIGPNTT